MILNTEKGTKLAKNRIFGQINTKLRGKMTKIKVKERHLLRGSKKRRSGSTNNWN